MEIVNNPTEPKPELSGMLKIKSANEWAREAALRPDPKPLWLSLWYEGEVCCLFADSNLGKSIYAVEIASEIAKTQKVIYFDFELSDKQFQLRYSDDNGNLYTFSDNLLRSEIDPDMIGEGNFEDEVIADIEGASIQYDCKVLIVDNITYLNSVTEKADAASMLMMRLMQLKKKHGLSILVLAHTPKRPLTSPITQNDLAGSKKLFNFFDSVFAIGRSAKDENLRYIKQVKVRAGAFEYGAENVIVSEIVKENSWLHFRNICFATEREHLKEQTDKDISSFDERVKGLRADGKSIREIADSLGVSKSKIGNIIKKLNL
ncbi:MAG: AAA family ATPase [Muribaculaceae bacterium]|nr:AAA family ATPase [Muribaculaceae bacterium]